MQRVGTDRVRYQVMCTAILAIQPRETRWPIRRRNHAIIVWFRMDDGRPVGLGWLQVDFLIEVVLCLDRAC